MTVRITEAELARNVRAVLEKIERGTEVVVEREDHRPVAVIKAPQPVGREIEACIALARAYEEKLGDTSVPDESFAKDVLDGVETHREPMRNLWDK